MQFGATIPEHSQTHRGAIGTHELVHPIWPVTSPWRYPHLSLPETNHQAKTTRFLASRKIRATYRASLKHRYWYKPCGLRLVRKHSEFSLCLSITTIESWFQTIQPLRSTPNTVFPQSRSDWSRLNLLRLHRRFWGQPCQYGYLVTLLCTQPRIKYDITWSEITRNRWVQLWNRQLHSVCVCVTQRLLTLVLDMSFKQKSSKNNMIHSMQPLERILCLMASDG